MTEEEAKTKECPHFSVGVAIFMASGKGENFNGRLDTKCIGSACMMWRFQMKYVESESAGSGLVKTMTIAKYEKSEHGYCGLAGKP